MARLAPTRPTGSRTTDIFDLCVERLYPGSAEPRQGFDLLVTRVRDLLPTRGTRLAQTRAGKPSRIIGIVEESSSAWTFVSSRRSRLKTKTPTPPPSCARLRRCSISSPPPLPFPSRRAARRAFSTPLHRRRRPAFGARPHLPLWPTRTP